jgi:DNA-directed RNA polymerase subunit omega
MDEARIDRLARRAGGRFKLASLVMKRLVDINRGSQPLAEIEGNSMLRTVLKEVEMELVRLVPRLPAPSAAENPGAGDLIQED